MKVSKLIEQLQEVDQDREVMILDNDGCYHRIATDVVTCEMAESQQMDTYMQYVRVWDENIVSVSSIILE